MKLVDKVGDEEIVDFLRVDDLKGSVMNVKVVGSGEMETKYGRKVYLDLETPIGKRRWLLGKINVKKLVDMGYKDTEELHGKMLVIYTTERVLKGETVKMITIANVGGVKTKFS